MAKHQPLAANQLYRQCNPNDFAFQTTEELEPLAEHPGQERAVGAFEFGVSIKRKGYNIFAVGESGCGRHTMVKDYLEKESASQPVPDDWCYVYNFHQPEKPLALRLPAGRGVQFAHDMQQLVEDLHAIIPSAFESDEYRARKRLIEQEFEARHDRVMDNFRERARKKQVSLVPAAAGFVFAPMVGDEVMTPEDFQKLTEEEREKIEETIRGLQKEWTETLQQGPIWQKEMRQMIKELDHEISRYAVSRPMGDLALKYRDLSEVQEYLETVSDDLISHASDFIERPADAANLMMPAPNLSRYQVNVLVDNSETVGAPVIFTDSPSYANLIGRIENRSSFGNLVTDFTLIKPGVLHRASGGFLILDAVKLLTQPFAWEALKRTLIAQEITIEGLEQRISLVSMVSLEPQPIPLDVKVVLIGERYVHQMLSQYDPEFAELFKVLADFDCIIDRDAESQRTYARWIAHLAQGENLRPLDRSGVARVIEQASRMVADTEKMSILSRQILELLQESDHWAVESGHETISDIDVQKAVEMRLSRRDSIREKMQEMILRETILVDTEGEAAGQINGLSVIDLGGFMFGRPSRITARVRIGSGQVVDIEREVKLGGPLHSKGVMILASYLSSHYCPDWPLSLAASLVFEQSYGGVDGDSASSAELYALLSAISGIPINQAIAVTGSVNQVGEVQAIGGANEKIEGFFDICEKRGLTGRQGVMIPDANVKNLMLKPAVRAACEAGQFAVFAVSNIAEGIEVLTGMHAGERGPDGKFPSGSFNALVEQRLEKMAKTKSEKQARDSQSSKTAWVRPDRVNRWTKRG